MHVHSAILEAFRGSSKIKCSEAPVARKVVQVNFISQSRHLLLKTVMNPEIAVINRLCHHDWYDESRLGRGGDMLSLF